MTQPTTPAAGRPDTHARFEELAAGHALSSLEPEDTQVFLSHLPSCAQCERELVDHAVTMAHLAYAADPHEPPAALLAGIRAGVEASGRGSTLSSRSAPVSLAERRGRADRSRRAATWTGVAAALALVATLGVWNVGLRAEVTEQERRQSRVAAALSGLGASGTETVPLTDDAGSVLAVAVVRPDGLSLLVDGLAVNDRSDTTYVLWSRDQQGAVRAVTAFDVTGAALDVGTQVPLPAGSRPPTDLLVSREAGRTAPAAPAGPVLASGQV